MSLTLRDDLAPPAGDDDRHFAAARAICRRHARSFYFSSIFLPKPKRLAAYAVYAFCRLLDDSVDSSPIGAERRVEEFEQLLGRIYDDDPPAGDSEPSLALRAFHATVRRYDIPRRYFDDLAQGCRMDLTVTRYQSWPDLEWYCYHVAGVVGLMMTRIFAPDVTDEPTLRQAVAMGNAMQLTNILRDVKEDLHRGRIYLPREDLDRFNIGPAALAAGSVDENFRRLMSFQIARACALYRDGAEGLCRLADDGSRSTASAMAVIYAGILRAIERRGYDVFTSRARVSFIGKASLIPSARRLARRRAGEPIPDVF